MYVFNTNVTFLLSLKIFNANTSKIHRNFFLLRHSNFLTVVHMNFSTRKLCKSENKNFTSIKKPKPHWIHTFKFKHSGSKRTENNLNLNFPSRARTLND